MNEFDPLEKTPENDEKSSEEAPQEMILPNEEPLSAEKSVTMENAVKEETAEKEEEEEALPSDDEKKDAPLSTAGNIFDWCKSFLFSLTAVIFIFTLLFRGVTVNGVSMLPTLENGEYLIISDLLYEPKGGDIVVVQAPNYKKGTEPLIKRIIATAGQEVKINFNTWEVWVDGEKLNEDYVLFEPDSTMLVEDMKPDENGEVSFTVEENSVFLMGDHRNDSLDSRSNNVGQIDERYIMGRVIVRITPFDRFGKVD